MHPCGNVVVVVDAGITVDVDELEAGAEVDVVDVLVVGLAVDEVDVLGAGADVDDVEVLGTGAEVDVVGAGSVDDVEVDVLVVEVGSSVDDVEVVGGATVVVVVSASVDVVVVDDGPVVVVPLSQAAPLCWTKLHSDVPIATMDPSPQRISGSDPKTSASTNVVPESVGTPS